MKTFWMILAIFTIGLGILYFGNNRRVSDSLDAIPKPTADQIPNDWFWKQRAYPQGSINYQAFEMAQTQAAKLKGKMKKSQPFWKNLGPTLVGGRMTDIEILPDGTWLAGAASGGIFRSRDDGQTWQPIFDEAFSLSIGDIAFAPSNPKILYVGTGEANGGGGSSTYAGVGVYRSEDGGDTWSRRGLPLTRFIGRMAVHPGNPEVVYAAAMGSQFSFNEERGLYRSDDGGLNWEKILYLSERTGCIDVVIDPTSPNRMFAAMWQRRRTASDLFYGGPESGVYSSQDGGDSWQKVQGGLPESDDLGRIGLAIAASDPNIMYAQYFFGSDGFAGVFKSVDGGETWLRTNDQATTASYRNAGSWFGQVRVHPQDPDYVFALGVLLHFSRDGGNSWQEYRQYAFDQGLNFQVHVDQHGMAFDPHKPNSILLANDGGIYLSSNQVLEFNPRNNFSNIQFYRCEIDPSLPNRVYGGTQDNGTWGTLNSEPDNWVFYLGGDGFHVEVDPTNSRSIYFEFQFGGLFHFLNGQYIDGRGHFEDTDRGNWDAPILIDPNDPRVVYHASQRLFRTNSGVTNFVPISGDLTKGDPGGNRVFGSLTAVAVAKGDSNVIYVGADDGNLQVTFDGGETWQNRTAGLPQRWVRAIAVHPNDPNTAFVAVSGYRQSDYQPHLLKTQDGGEQWEDITQNLPEAPLNDVIVDPEDPDRMYVASDLGVFYSSDGGDAWAYLGQGMPSVPVNDLDLHAPSKTLVAATYGRGMFRLDLTEILEEDAVAGTQLPRRYVLPELHGALAGTSFIGLVNPGDDPVTLELFAFDAAGEELEKSPESSVFEGRQKRWLTLAEAFPTSHQAAAWVQVGSDGQLVVFAEIGDAQARAAYLAETIQPGTAYLPHVAKDTDQFQTFISSVNPHATGLQTRIQPGLVGADDPVREHFSKYTKMSRDVRDYFGQNLNSVAFAQIKEPLRGAVSMEFFHRLPTRSQMAALGINTKRGTNLRFLHVASDTGNFWTGMVYINIGQSSSQVTERFYARDGQLLDTRTRETVAVAEKVVLLFDQENAQGLPDNTAWIDVEADQDLIGYDLFGASTSSPNDFFAGIQGAFTTSSNLVYPHFLAGENQWLGLVAVNTGSESADLNLQVFAADGSLLEEKSLTSIPAKGKQTLLVGDFFEIPATLTKGAWIRLQGESPVWNGFLLWGDQGVFPRQVMSGMVAVPLE